MTSKRKSVTFREQLSEVYPNSMDGSSSPDTTTISPTSLDLDPMYLTWLRSATKAQYPFIIDGTFGKQIYHQNFNIHQREKSQYRQQLIPLGEAAVAPLAEKYGSLGWGSLYQHINTEAWVKNYREIYHFSGTDEQLLSAIAQAYAHIKHAIAQEKESETTPHAHLNGSTPHPRSWTAFTQAGGALRSPDFGPSGVTLPFNNHNNAAHAKEAPVQFRPRAREAKRDEVSFEMNMGVGKENAMAFDMNVGVGDGNAMMYAGTGTGGWMYGAGPVESGVRWQMR